MLLDVRPEEEKARVRVLGAVEVPVFVVDNDTSLSSLIKHVRLVRGLAGWWAGWAGGGFVGRMACGATLCACVLGRDTSLSSPIKNMHAVQLALAWHQGTPFSTARSSSPSRYSTICRGVL